MKTINEILIDMIGYWGTFHEDAIIDISFEPTIYDGEKPEGVNTVIEYHFVVYDEWEQGDYWEVYLWVGFEDDGSLHSYLVYDVDNGEGDTWYINNELLSDEVKTDGLILHNDFFGDVITQYEKDMATLDDIIVQLKLDSGIDWIGIWAAPIEDIRDIDPSFSEDTVGIFLSSFYFEGDIKRYIYIEKEMFEGPRSELLSVIYHEIAHAITENIYDWTEHSENFQDTLEQLVEDGFVAGTLTQADLDVFEANESWYNPDGIDRSDYILNDESDAVKLANFEIWLSESNPHEIGSLLADRWDTIQRGNDVFEDNLAPYLLDLNQDGDVDISDIIDILRDIVGLEELTDSEYVLADANKDGVVNISDAISGLRVIVGLTTVDALADDYFVAAPDIT